MIPPLPLQLASNEQIKTIDDFITIERLIDGKSLLEMLGKGLKFINSTSMKP
jgi:hypothetical protein